MLIACPLLAAATGGVGGGDSPFDVRVKLLVGRTGAPELVDGFAGYTPPDQSARAGVVGETDQGVGRL